MSNIPIRFEEIQLLSFVLIGSFFTYLTLVYLSWLIKNSKPRKRRLMARAP